MRFRPNLAFSKYRRAKAHVGGWRSWSPLSLKGARAMSNRRKQLPGCDPVCTLTKGWPQATRWLRRHAGGRAMVAREARADCFSLRSKDVELAKGLPVESFSVLWRASQYAQNARCGVWHFAVGLSQLRQGGLSKCDRRWLACKGYVEHSLEPSPFAACHRKFDSSPTRRFTDHSTFVLTPRGQMLAKSLLTGAAVAADAASASDTAAPQLVVCPAPLPTWDHQRRELRIGRTVIKRFCVPAENQETILSAFEEEAWTVHIDDPLPPAAGIDPKRRLHSTIPCLICSISMATEQAVACGGSCFLIRPARDRLITSGKLLPVCLQTAYRLRVGTLRVSAILVRINVQRALLGSCSGFLGFAPLLRGVPQ